jgi:uncharacterized membrane protein YeiH
MGRFRFSFVGLLVGAYGHWPRAAGYRSSTKSERDVAARSSHGPKAGTVRAHDAEVRVEIPPARDQPSSRMLHTLDLIGVGVFAISGALAAGRKHLDLLGVIVLGLVTAIGGGTIRDVFLDRHPLFWLADSAYLVVIIVSALLTVAYVRWRPVPAATLLYADAIGLAMFSISGAQIAERAGMPALSCVALGTITGAAGGVVRDVLSAQIPLVLQRGNLYASAAIAGTSLYFLLTSIGAPRVSASLAGMAVVAAVRLASIVFGLQLPVFALGEDGVPQRRDRTS